MGAHDRVVRTEEVHVAAGTASESGGLAKKDRGRLGSRHGVRNVAAIRPWRTRGRERESVKSVKAKA